ncbi:recombinase family protein [Lederbergia citri]|uniref:Recombinase family protein n=1 Tax=Lederbergia citri TaxID=2833580 RepID=A0A942TBG7_9BACI|nr:recombinase family protein [Lederbergia citri]MBS4194650.1 recombinase family protein [Lederbergia citri]
MKKVAVYTRVSTKKDEQALSFKSQNEYYTDYCIKKGYDLVKLYADKGLSATSARREEFLFMIHDAGIDYKDMGDGRSFFKASTREPLFNLIIVKDHTRFSRNSTDGMELAKQLQEKNVSILFESSGLMTGEPNWEFTLDLLFNMAEQESRSLSQKVSWGKRVRAEQGIYHMTRLSLGYGDRDEYGNYTINEDEAEIVKKIFYMYTREDDPSKRIGTTRIAKYLNSFGVPTKENKKWSSDKVLRILRDTKYYGDVYVQRTTRKQITSSKRTERDKEDWVLIENAVPPIIDKKTYDLTQKIIKENTISHDGQIKGVKKYRDDIYFRKIECGTCGTHFVRHSKIKKVNDENEIHYLYMCESRRKHGDCNQRGISEGVLTRNIASIDGETIRTLSKKFAREEEVFNIILNRIKIVEEVIREVHESIDKKIAEIIEEKNKIFEQIMSIGTEAKSIVKLLNEKVETLENELLNLSQQRNKYDKNMLTRFERDLRKKYDEVIKFSKRERFPLNEIIKLIKKIIVHPNKEFTVILSSPSVNGFYNELHNLQKSIYKLGVKIPAQVGGAFAIFHINDDLKLHFKY